eukprot:CAMPEP_0182446774 /NCGR_PEP_ID=MMETSP1172-20130603/5996_1 /TAXON_ID=708627 /ORGANISM="Timspurckia oligopyrenoides, Strain CCMP3278" /LENGTH=119 /DNA_ID=CAMNT_0024642851 /DNA_START=223 /DNA_END=582 /DNA_ORIENTATION=-
MAFVSGFGIGSGPALGAQSKVSAFSGVRQSASVASKRVVLNMKVDDKVKSTLQNDKKIASNEPGLGWSLSNEKLNGRLAMLGFALALVTEAIAPGHPSIVQQVVSIVPDHIQRIMSTMI